MWTPSLFAFICITIEPSRVVRCCPLLLHSSFFSLAHCCTARLYRVEGGTRAEIYISLCRKWPVCFYLISHIWLCRQAGSGAPSKLRLECAHLSRQLCARSVRFLAARVYEGYSHVNAVPGLAFRTSVARPGLPPIERGGRLRSIKLVLNPEPRLE